MLGLAKSTVQGTLTMAKSAMEEEEKLQKAVKQDLKIISDEFEMMHAFLDSTKQDGHVTDSVTRTTLVRQVRDMALDVEDCIDFAIHLDKKQSNWWRRMIPSSVLPAAPGTAELDASVADIEVVKARVEAMGLRNMRYSSIGDSGPPAKLPAEPHQQTATAGNAAAASDILAAVRGAARMHSRKVGLIKLILGEEEQENDDDEMVEEEESSMQSFPASAAGVLKVISVLGTRNDLGSMSIKEAYDHPQTCRSFRCRA